MNQLITTIRRHWLSLFLLNGVLLSATAFVIIYVEVIAPKVWKSNARFILPIPTGGGSASLGSLGDLKSGSGITVSDQLNPLTVQTSIITSDAVFARIWAADPERSLYPKLKNYKALFTVTPANQSPIMDVEAQGSTPELARQRIATLTKVYQARLNELRQNDTDNREQPAQEELERSRNNLVQAQNALAKFQQSTGLINSDEQAKNLIATITDLKNTQATVMADGQGSATQAKLFAARLNTTPQQAMNSLRLGENKEYQSVRDKLSQVETNLAAAKGVYTAEHPQVQSLLLQRQELLRDLRQRIATALPGNEAKGADTSLGGNGGRDSRIDMIVGLINTEAKAAGLEQQARQIQNQVDKLNAELSFITRNKAQLADLQRKYDIAEGVYKGIIAQVQQAKLDTFNSYPSVQLLDGPTSDPEPSKPRLLLIALGGILASIFGSVALVLFQEGRNPLLKAKDLQQVEFPLLVSISRLKRPDIERDLEAEIEIDFQRLASVISSLTLKNHRLMVTSSTFGEGKTTVTLGLALALVNFGFRVLVVDGDLRHAELGRRLGYSQAQPETNSKPVPISISPGLDLLPAPFIPKDKIAQFFARGKFERNLNLIQNAGDYDYVLVDSAPINLAIESTLMSAVVENVLFVVRPGTSDRYTVMDGFEQITQHNAQIKGVVVNGVKTRTEGYYYGHKRELVEAEEA
jgi:uncharacterized protein involved in exopolysaccharide biosynthesis/Mrp family chromosome partitioning ATPase